MEPCRNSNDTVCLHSFLHWLCSISTKFEGVLVCCLWYSHDSLLNFSLLNYSTFVKLCCFLLLHTMTNYPVQTLMFSPNNLLKHVKTIRIEEGDPSKMAFHVMQSGWILGH